MKSQPVALLGEAPPRVLVTPQGVRANSWQDVADLSGAFGIALDGWQELILEAAMGERSDHTWAAKRVGISVPRQNGKSQLLVARALAGALVFGEKKIVVSAHQQDTARESFSKLMEIIEADENASLRDRVKSVMNALNRESVKFSNGAVIQFKARSGAAGKGFSSDCLLLDEAQILGSRAWTSINSTMSAMRNPQVWLLGTPPQNEDDCYAFEMVRSAALAGKSSAAAWCEWSADPASDEYDPAGEYTRWSANPAWNSRINHEVVQGEYETYSSDRFAQDRLGQWPSQDAQSTIFPRWQDCRLDVAELPPLTAIGLAVSVDGDYGSIAAARAWDDGRINLGAVERRPGSTWLVAEAKRIQQKYGCAVAMDEKCPDATLYEALVAAGVDVQLMKLADYVQTTSNLENRVRELRLTHQDTDELTRAVATAKWRPVGDGQKVPGRRKSEGDIDMLEGAAAALWATDNAVEPWEAWT